MEGANLSGDLKAPSKSLPKGTLLAVLTSLFVYIAFTVLLAACFRPEDLQQDWYVLQETAVSRYVVIVGIAMATLSTALGALFGGARILQAIARDKLFPGLGLFGKGSVFGDEPRRAVLVTWLLAQAFGFIGSLNSVAPILTDFFLTAYALVGLNKH